MLSWAESSQMHYIIFILSLKNTSYCDGTKYAENES